MQLMKLEEADTLKFDLEILTDEKNLLEGDLDQLKDLLSSNERKL